MLRQFLALMLRWILMTCLGLIIWFTILIPAILGWAALLRAMGVL